MTELPRTRILLGVTGGIAAYKAAELVRRLGDALCDVQVVMTAGAEAFVTPMTFQALSGRTVRTSLFDPAAEAAMGHIELARWADQIVIAPATADAIARLATGQADDLLTTVVLASTAPLSIAPAMNQAMWAHPATQANVATLLQRGVNVLGPASGEQACGDVGAGRMLEPEDIAAAVTTPSSTRLAGRRAVITAGPTLEAVDPVRYLSNHSSGKMGYAVASALARAGAEVTLVSGPTALASPPGVSRVDVQSARDMLEAVMGKIDSSDLFVGCAAVADYHVAEPASQKIKKHSDTLTLSLERNPDILAQVAALPSPPICVGFAAETNDMQAHAQDKLARKKLHLICANSVGGENSAFGADDNALELWWPNGGHARIERAPKTEVARQLVEQIATLYFDD
ncbi:MAG: bifunctional phosphopantothenoylcysteine decarboxylase/phosphopantothenate--cysteine ligase CoaBC [Pseudomonadota bacterium]